MYRVLAIAASRVAKRLSRQAVRGRCAPINSDPVSEAVDKTRFRDGASFASEAKLGLVGWREVR